MTAALPPLEPRSQPIDVSQLYRAHAPDVYRFALFLSGNAAMAEDLTAEAFARLWHARARVDLPTVKAYLFTIARNLYLQERRRRRPPVVDRVDWDEIADSQPSPVVQTMARLDLEATLADLQRLSEGDRAALLLRADDQLSYEEIAATLGITAGAARVRVHRARLRLAQERDRRAIKKEQPR